jgi:RNA polymerase sigma factor
MFTNDILNEKISIQERVEKAKKSEDASNALISDYLLFIRSEASKATGRIISEQDDEFSVAMIGFNEAIKSYEETRGAFLKYASVIMRNKLIDEHRKQKKHMIPTSIDEFVFEDGETSVVDNIEDGKDEYSQINLREATQQEIAELVLELRSFGLTLSDIAENCPKQERTLESCYKVLKYVTENPELLITMKRTMKLPMAQIVLGTEAERKTLERHRKYLIALLLIYSNGYEIIREHLKDVLKPGRREGLL